MTNAALTPGPWTYQYSPYTSQDGEEVPAFEVHGPEKVCDTNEGRPMEEQEANARLIAAAPELLAALRLVAELKLYGETITDEEFKAEMIAIDQYDQEGNFFTPTMDTASETLAYIVEIARAAIAKWGQQSSLF